MSLSKNQKRQHRPKASPPNPAQGSLPSPAPRGQPPDVTARLKQWISQQSGLLGLVFVALLVVAGTVHLNWGEDKNLPGAWALTDEVSKQGFHQPKASLPDPAHSSSSNPPPPEKQPPDLRTLLKQWIYQRYGFWGSVVLAILAAAGLTIWNWDKVKNLLGVSTFISWMSRKPLPKADPKRFAVAIAHLDNDKDRQYERLIVEALKEIQGVQILQFDRTIPLEGAQPEERVKAGHDKAREYLNESGAHILIWGTVLSRDDSSLPKLYWTPSKDLGERQARRYQLTEDLGLPDIFWSDLADILRLLVLNYHTGFSAQEGHFVADQLAPFIEKVRQMLKVGQQQGWNAEARAQVQFILAGSLLTFGEQVGNNEPLEEAVAAYREALTEYTRERVPLQWAMTQNNLGNALRTLGERRRTSSSR